MVVVMKQDATDSDIEAVCEKVRNAGGEAFVSRGAVHTVVGLVGDTARFQAIPFTQLAGVDHVIQIGKPYKMVARDLHPEATTVMVGSTPVGRGTFTIIAGPCAVESEEQALIATRAAKAAGATVLRGDVYKPRTSPVLVPGARGARTRDPRGMPARHRPADHRRGGRRRRRSSAVAEIADCIRVGTRNAQNFELLKEVGLTNKPVMLKRGLAMTIDEWLQAAEYVAQRGNSEVILCERGIRTFEPATRNTLDLAGMAVAQHESHLPVIVDPSHAVGKKHLVAPMARAAVAAGADAVMIDVHHDPEARCATARRRSRPRRWRSLGKELATLAEAMGRPVNR